MEQKKMKRIFQAPADILGNVTRQVTSQVKSATEPPIPKPPSPPKVETTTPKAPSYATPTAINRMDTQVTTPKPPSPPKVETITPKPPASTYLTGGATAPDTPYAPGLQAQRQTGVKEIEQPHILPQAATIQQEKRWVAEELGKEAAPVTVSEPEIETPRRPRTHAVTPTRRFTYRHNVGEGEDIAYVTQQLEHWAQVLAADQELLTQYQTELATEPSQEHRDALGNYLEKVRQDVITWNGYMGRYQDYYSPEAFQSRIDALEAELAQKQQETSPTQYWDPGRISYSQRQSLDSAAADVKELEKKLEEERASKQYIEDQAQFALARTAPEAFQRNLAALRQSLGRAEAENADEKTTNDILKKIKRAETIQKAVGYEAYQQLEDFQELGKPGETRGEYGGFLRAPADHAFLYDFINDLGDARAQVGFIDRDGHYQVFVGEGRPGGSYQKYLYLTPTEKMTFNAIDKLEGEEAALRYLDFLTEELNQRQGVDTYENMPLVGKALYWAPAGVDQFAGGVAQLFSKKALPTSPVQYTSALVRNEAHDTNPALGFAYDAGTTIANVAPSILAAEAAALLGGPAAGEVVGNALVGLSTAGNAYNQKVKEGYPPEQARRYAALVGASESLLQYYLGGIAQLGGVDKAKLLDRVAQIDNGLVRFVAKAGVHGLPEMGEETLQALLAPAFAAAVFHEDYEVDLGDVAYSALMGFATGDVFALPDIIGVDTKRTTSTGEVVRADTSLFQKSILQNLNQARSSFIEFAHKYFPASVKNIETGREIGISRRGLDKFLSGRIAYEKYASGFHIPELIERAHRVTWATNEHPEQVDSIPTYEYYDSPIDIDGRAYMAHIRVRNTRMGDKYYGHTISEIEDIKIEPSARTSVPRENPAGQPVNAVDGSVNSIPKNVPDVNPVGSPGTERVGTMPPTGERRALTGESETMPTLNKNIYHLLQKVKSTAEEMVERPEGLPESILKQFRPLWEKQTAAAKRKALGDLLGFTPEFQKSVEIFLDKTLADAEDIARWESLNLPPETWQHLQPMYQEKKASIQWLEDYLAKMEERNGGEQRGGIITFPE